MNEDSNADALVSFFDGLSREIKKDIVKRGVTRATVAVHNRAMENVNGPRSAPARSYPVPVRTAELRNGIKAKLPGQAKGLPNMPDGVPPGLAGAVVSEAPHSDLIHDGHAEPIEIRPVKVGERVDSLWVVTDNLKPGERVVVEGMQKARPGVPVVAKPWVATQPAPATPAPKASRSRPGRPLRQRLVRFR